ncbi:MAG: pilin [Patescibacteria group bacterium]
MKKKLFFIFALSVLFIPIAVFAADPTASLEGTGPGLVPQCEGAFCRACDLTELANNVINFGVAFSVVVATLMFAYAGILYVTAAGKGADQVKKAHGIFVNVFVGLVIVLISWLLIDIGFSVLTGQGLSVWSHIDCIANPITKAFPDAPADTGGAGSWGSTLDTSVPTKALSSGALDQAEAVRRLVAAGVCTPSTCLAGGSLEGIKSNTIDQLIQIHKACNCQFTITSGVRLDGTPHSTGYKVDLRTNNKALDTFLSGLSPGEDHPGWDKKNKVAATVHHDNCGNLYALEKPLAGSSSGAHWDLSIVNGVCAM